MNCRDRNGVIAGYRVVYSSSDAPNINIRAQIISGTQDSGRMFTETGLPPHSSYIFRVQASNILIDVRGAAGSLNVTPQVHGTS